MRNMNLGDSMDFADGDDKWELDTQAYVETYRKEIILKESNIEHRFRLSLVSEEEPCKKCGGIRFIYLVEVWDEEKGWIHLHEYDDNYFCSNEICNEDSIKPHEFERFFRSIQKESKYKD